MQNLAIVTALICLAVAPAVAAERYAFLVGVREYDRTQLNPLSFTENDATRLADVLKQTGYREQDIVLMTQTVGATKTRFLPIADKIRKELALLLRQVRQEDSILVALSGHGVQFAGEEDLFYCPADADLKNRATLISLGEIYKDLETCPAAVKLLLVDACRNDPLSNLGKSGRVAELQAPAKVQPRDPPRGIAAFFSCSRGEQAFEHPQLKQGIFFHFVARALSGAADFDKDQQISLPELEQYAMGEVQRYARVELGVAQTPERRGQARGLVTLATLTRPAATPKDPPPLANSKPPVRPPPPRVEDPKQEPAIENSIGMKLVLIPAGEFMMGSTAAQVQQVAQLDSSLKKEAAADQQPQHKVRITRPFYLSTREVTKAEFARFVQEERYSTELAGAGGWGVNAVDLRSEGPVYKYSWRYTGFAYDNDHPVVNVSWADAVAFCKWLSAKDKREYRLPTEAEWEYACRAGSTTLYQRGDEPDGVVVDGNVADGTYKEKLPNQAAVSALDGCIFTAPAGQFRANAFGLFDMHGNVSEWCADWYEKDYYKSSPQADPAGAKDGSQRIVRGGSWNSSAAQFTSAARARFEPRTGRHDLGFRVAISTPGSSPQLAKSNTSAPPAPPSAPPRVDEPLGDQVENSLGMKLVRVPAGELLMGTTLAQVEKVVKFDPTFKKEYAANEQPQHKVRIAKAFHLGIHEVTKGQFAKFVDDEDYQTEAEKSGGGTGYSATSGKLERDTRYNWRNTGYAQDDDHPVVNVSWNDAVAFCRWLSGKENREYRLPSEAEWEYACRAGSRTHYHHGDDPEGLAVVGNVADGTHRGQFPSMQTIAARDGYVFTAPVGQFRGNAFGLFDMDGNVKEWCSDWYRATYYRTAPATDVRGPPSGAGRVLRGASWAGPSGISRSASRNGVAPSLASDFVGFRVALSQPDQK